MRCVGETPTRARTHTQTHIAQHTHTHIAQHTHTHIHTHRKRLMWPGYPTCPFTSTNSTRCLTHTSLTHVHSHLTHTCSLSPHTYIHIHTRKHTHTYARTQKALDVAGLSHVPIYVNELNPLGPSDPDRKAKLQRYTPHLTYPLAHPRTLPHLTCTHAHTHTRTFTHLTSLTHLPTHARTFPTYLCTHTHAHTHAYGQPIIGPWPTNVALAQVR